LAGDIGARLEILNAGGLEVHGRAAPRDRRDPAASAVAVSLGITVALGIDDAALGRHSGRPTRASNSSHNPDGRQ